MSSPLGVPGAPQRQGVNGGIVAAIAVGIVLVLAVCCLGGAFLVTREDDEPEQTPTTEPSEESSTEPTTESSSDSTTEPPAGPTTAEPEEPLPSPEGMVPFPASFGGWDNLSSEPGTTIAIFTKGEESFNVLSSTHATVETYEDLWEDPHRHGRLSCGKRVGAATVSCAVAAHDTTYYASSSDLTEEELADAVGTMLTQM